MPSVPRKWIFRSLSFRLNAWYASVLGLVFGAAALGVRLWARGAIDQAQHVLVETEIEQQRSQLESGGLSGFQDFVARRRETTKMRWFVRVSDDQGQTLVFDAPSAELDFSSEDLAPRPGAHTIHPKQHPEDDPWRVVSTRVVGRMWLQLGVEDRPRLDQLAAVERGFWALLALGLSLGTLGGWIVTRRALAPLRVLAETSRRIVAGGELDARVPLPDSADELAELSSLFNRVLDRNQRLVEGMRQALDNVAHDLRTPLSSLRSSAELALQRENDAELLREALADCVEDSERVLSMLHTLMDISEAETGTMQLALEPLRLDGLAREAYELYQHVAEERGLHFTCEAAEAMWIRGDRQRLSQAIANLIDNALKYTDPGGRVTLHVTQLGAKARLCVTDTGAGIEAVHLDKIWQRLYRADQSRSRRGLGLGLSLVKAIVEAHGGEARVQSEPGQGSRFELLLPLLESARGARPTPAAS